MKKIYINEKFPYILHGGDYNPDQWQSYPDILSEDMRLMKKANCNEMSLGIFAWSSLEPEEDKFDFSFLDKAMDDIYEAGGRVILATPSGARPQWMAQKYPEVLRWNNRFEKWHFGRRHNHCPSSSVYREKVKTINTKLAERYKDHPALIAWHLSNEYGGECFCPKCQEAFRGWLKNKYGTLERLNEQWWTSFWSHTYTDWNQIEPPSPLGETSVHGLTVDWRRFMTDLAADFMKAEYSTVKAITPDIPATTNLMELYNFLDYRKFTQSLDFVSYDCYPRWEDNDHDIVTASNTAMIYDLNRSLKFKPFLLMESTPSNVNWHDFNKLKRPGMHELASLQAIAHGSDSVQYFQWRKSRGSAEKFHGAVVDHEGSENTRVFKEVSALGERLKKLNEIAGTMPDSKVAVLYDWSNKWAIDDSQGFVLKSKKVIETVQRYYHPLWKNGIDTDIIGFEDNFSKYSVIIAPMLYMVSEELGEKLAQFVKNGGTLLCTYMTAMVNENDLCHLGGFPGAGLRKVFGIWNEEIDTLYPQNIVKVKTEAGETEAIDYCELIHLEGAKAIAEYASEFYKGMPAATVNNYGKGKAYYVAFRDKGEYTDSMVDRLLKEKNITSYFDGKLPYGVTAHSRTDGDKKYIFLQNFSQGTYKLSTSCSWQDVETGGTYNNEIILAPLETKIIIKVAS